MGSTDRMASQPAKDVRVTVIGQMPPPSHGQSLMTARMTDLLRARFQHLRVVDTSEGVGSRWGGLLRKTRSSMRGIFEVTRTDVVYAAVNAGSGMWLTAALALAARLAGTRIYLHHHSYSYIGQRTIRMLVLARVAGPRANHIVLSATMAKELVGMVPRVTRPLILGPAWRVERELLDLPLARDGSAIVLGHLAGPLTLEKGIDQVVNLALALREDGVRVRLIVGGPVSDVHVAAQLERAAEALGDSFEHRGPLAGESKRDFYGDITHFVLPTRYRHEAVPAVLFEAMAAGAVCVATRQGLIEDQLAGTPSILADSDSFLDDVLPELISRQVSAVDSGQSRQAFLKAQADSEGNLQALLNIMSR